MIITTNRLVASLFSVLLFGAALFSLERVLFADASFILFKILNESSLQIQEHRYGSFITQSFPLLAAYLHLPLQAVVFLYSISFNLFYLAVALLLLYHFKEQQLAILMSFYYILFASDTFFWMNNEVHQGIAWMFLFFASVLALGKKKVHWLLIYPVFLLLAFLALYTHPLLLFPTSYLWLFFCVRKDWPFPWRQTSVFTILLLLLALSKLYLSTGASSHYDVEKLQTVRQFSLEKVGPAFRSTFATETIKRTFWNYWLIPLLFFTGVLAACQKKAWWHLVLTFGYTMVYFLALSLTFHDFLPFYTESELMPATIFLTTPFVYYYLPGLKPKTQCLLLATIFIVRLSYIGFASQNWVERKDWIMRTLERMHQQNITKSMIYENDEIRRKLQLTWGTPAESMLASALQGDRPQRIFVVDNPENLKNRITPDNAHLIASFEIIPASSLNKRYFSVDTTTAYRVLEVK